MLNGWTGGQFSLVRVLTAVLMAGLLGVVLADAAAVPVGVAAVLFVPTVAVALGYRSRLAAILLAAGLALLVAMQGDPRAWPGLAPWGLVVGVLVMVSHALLAAPPPGGEPAYGSLEARGRVDPAGRWHFPPWLFQAVWLTLGAFYLGAAVVLLRDEAWRLAEALFYDDGQWAVLPWVGAMPEWLGRTLTWLLLGTWLAFGPLALARRNRRLAWALAAGVNLLVLPLAGYWALALALTAMHLLAFNPTWLRPAVGAAPETVFYDGECGLCHRGVRFLLAEDAQGQLFALSPLGSEHFRERVPAERREQLPDSIVVLRAEGGLLLRSTAVLHTLDRLGGLWRVVARVGQAVPEAVRDAVYDRVAAVRRRLFDQPTAACPMMPPTLRARFRM